MEGAGDLLVAAIDAVAREATLFAAIWFLVGGIDDLLIDLVYFARRARRSWLGRHASAPSLGDFRIEDVEGRIAVFVPAWQEEQVIGRMLASALDRFDHRDYRIYVGTYPNDAGTIDAVAAVAGRDARVRLVVGARPGPTTKADCLNTLWRALLRDEAVEGAHVKGVVLHDAEDVVHPGELRLFDRYLRDHAAVQLPVLPLVDSASRFVSGHYCDEFAEAHAKTLVVREALRAGLPLAGVGCAISRAMLADIAAGRQGDPFDASSLTEDYELGLTIAAMGGRSALVRIPESPGGPPVAVRAYFPDAFRVAVRQKARWMTGIALAGWDRIGWGAAGDWGDHWMRMRDRRATLAMPVLAVGWFALVAWGASTTGHAISGGAAAPPDPLMRGVLIANVALLAWRLAMRALFVGRAYGARQAALSVPRLIVANFISLAAARRAASAYVRMLRGGAPVWDKTPHQFPDDPGRAAA